MYDITNMMSITLEQDLEMNYVEIWKERIAGGEATYQEAFDWLLHHGMNPVKAWISLNE